MSDNESTSDDKISVSGAQILLGCIILGLIIWAVVAATGGDKQSSSSTQQTLSPTSTTSDSKLPVFKKPPPPAPVPNFEPIPTCFSSPTKSMFYTPLHDAFLLLYPTLHIYEIKDQGVVLQTPGFTMERLLVSFVIIPEQDWRATEEARKRMTAAQMLDRYNAYKFLPGELQRGEAIILVKNENDCTMTVSIMGALFPNNESESFGPVCWYALDMNHNIMKTLRSQMIELFNDQYAPYKFVAIEGIYPKSFNEVVVDIRFNIEDRVEVGRFTFRQEGRCQNITIDTDTKKSKPASTTSDQPAPRGVLNTSTSTDTEVKIIKNLYADTSTVLRPWQHGGRGMLDPLCPPDRLCAYCVSKRSFAKGELPNNEGGIFDQYPSDWWATFPFSVVPGVYVAEGPSRKPLTTCPPGTEPVTHKPGSCIRCKFPGQTDWTLRCGVYTQTKAEVEEECKRFGGTVGEVVVGPRWNEDWLRNIE